MPKATYMYWQKRMDRETPNKELEEKMLEIRKDNKDYGYRRMQAELRNQGYIVNKKKVQRIMQKLGLQVTSFTRKSRKYSSYKGKIGTVAPNRIQGAFILMCLTRKSKQIPQSLNTMKWIRKGI